MARVIMHISPEISARFWAKVKKGPNCWEWTAAKHRNGYGAFGESKGSRSRLAHRYAWISTNGVVQPGTFVLHRCDNRACVRPSHLFLGTHQENVDDMVAKGRQGRGAKHGAAVAARCPRGARHYKTTLTADDVRAIRSTYAAGQTTEKALAARFGVSRGSINSILRRKSWGHL